MGTVILCDFDDTVADQNVASLILEHFLSGDRDRSCQWSQIYQRFAKQDISLAAYQEQAFDLLQESVEEQATYARNTASIRPGFDQLVHHCRSNGIELGIVSHGLDYYIRAVLDGAGLSEVSVTAVKTVVSGEAVSYSYPLAHQECQWYPGNCKCQRLPAHSGSTGHVVYVGDGRSDQCPAAKADFVFARDPLLTMCREAGIPHQELYDFFDVLQYLRDTVGEQK